MFYNYERRVASKMMTDELIAGRCAELATLVSRHTDGKGDGLHQTDIARWNLPVSLLLARCCMV